MGFDFIPLDAKLEALVGIVVSTFGALLGAHKMLPIDGSVSFNKVYVRACRCSAV